MNETLEKAVAAIEAQQPKARGAVWMVGEQLKDLLRDDPQHAGLILTDLENKSMSIAECEKKIREFGRKNGNVVTGIEADKIIREFYGLPERGTPAPAAKKAEVIDLADFL